MYTCINCEATAESWAGKCKSCDEWNVLVESTPQHQAETCRECSASLKPGQFFCTGCGLPTSSQAVEDLISRLPEKRKHGGARPNSGRPAKGDGPRVTKSFRLEGWAADHLAELATQRGESQADALHYVLRGDADREQLLDQVIGELAQALTIDRKASVSRTDIRNALALLEQLRR